MRVLSVLKKWKLLISAAFLMGAFLGLFWVYSVRERVYFNPVAIQLSTSGLPLFEVLIEDTACPIVFDLGSDQELSINSSAIEPFNKTYCGIERWMNYKGLEFSYPKYTLPKIQIGSQEFKDVTVATFPVERENDDVIWNSADQERTRRKNIGTIGREILGKMNALIDIENSKIIFTNSFKKLEEAGYNIPSFTKIPFTLTPLGIVLDVQTDLGSVKLVLDTGCTYTMLCDVLYPQNISSLTYRHGLPTLTTEKFSINGVGFGSKELYFLEIAEDFEGIDGLLGMDFIECHVMYIDFKNRAIYIQEP